MRRRPVRRKHPRRRRGHAGQWRAGGGGRRQAADRPPRLGGQQHQGQLSWRATGDGTSWRDEATYLAYAERLNPQAAAEYRRLWGGVVEPPRPLEPPPPPPPPPGAEDTLYWTRYIATYNDTVRSLGTDAAQGYAHYLATGRDAGRLAWFDPAAYFARYPAYCTQLRGDLLAGTRHFITVGYAKGYTWSNGPLYWLRYTASNPDLIPQLGTLPTAAEAHWHERGKAEGRKGTFNPTAYLGANAAARVACGTDQTCATKHFIQNAGR